MRVSKTNINDGTVTLNIFRYDLRSVKTVIHSIVSQVLNENFLKSLLH